MGPSFEDISDAKAAKYQVSWQRDEDSKWCSVCERSFSLLRRRHHCRTCGRLVCDACSTGRQRVPGSSNTKRVCDECVDNTFFRAPSPVHEEDDDEDALHNGNWRGDIEHETYRTSLDD